MKNSRILRVLLSLAAGAVIASCGMGENEPSLDEHGLGEVGDSRIVGGSSYSGLPAVGALTYYGSQHCTATLVEKRKVLTAAHCLEGVNRNKMRFVIGSSVFNADYTLKIASTHIHPNYDSNSITNDIGYAILTEDAPVAPMGILWEMDGSWRGEDLFFVGYGVTNGSTQAGAGTKRAVWMSISQVYSSSFRYDDAGKNTCSGDSGGPAFAVVDGEYVVAGVTSYGDWYCTDYGVDTRVDSYADWLGITAVAPSDPPTQEDPPEDPPPTADPCNGETFAGRCDGDAVIWCENDTVYQSNCASTDKTCGWSDANDYYACVEPPDPCNGETYEGRCDGKTVIWCENEEVKSINCRRACGWDNSGGYYNCE